MTAVSNIMRLSFNEITGCYEITSKNTSNKIQQSQLNVKEDILPLRSAEFEV
jgi:hypothetical protein